MGAAVLGIDAAWTAHNPSGVALVEYAGGWRLVAAARSFGDYLQDGPAPGWPPVAVLLAEAARRCGHLPEIIAVDMPLSRRTIRSRRASDDAVSRAYGARQCSTHTPSVARPGVISDRLSCEFAQIGYPLATSSVTGPALIEVYPHPALVELAASPRRLPYKCANVRRYWPGADPAARRHLLLSTWAEILTLLDAKVAGVRALLDLPGPDAPARILKGFEDMLDAVVCAWVGVCVLDGTAAPFGDEESAIWIPRPPFNQRRAETAPGGV